MNGSIIIFPVKHRNVEPVNRSLSTQTKPLNAVQKIKQKLDPDLMVNLVRATQTKKF